MKKLICILFSLTLLAALNGPYPGNASNSAKITMNEDGLVFVTGIESQHIHVISPYGQLIKKLALPNQVQTVDYISSCPCGGYLLISETQKGVAMTIDDRNGTTLFQFSGLQTPGPVAVSKHRSRYMAIVEQKKNAVMIYTERGSFVREISGRLRFKEANQILLDTENHLWVMDSASQKILRFNIQGNLLLTIHSSRQIPMKELVDMDIAHTGHLHVLDVNGTIWVFNMQGNLLESKDLQQQIPSPSYFCVHPNNQYYHVLTSSKQYFHLQSNLSVENKINNLSSEKIKKVILLRIGSRIIEHVGFELKLLDESPYIDPSSNRSMVPVRAIAEIFGAIVQWNSIKREVTIQWNRDTIRLEVNSDIAWINGTQYKLDAQPAIRNDRTFVPIRFIAEAFNSQIQWIARDQKVVISQ